mmetsp:Transcript_47359/g.115340  ORF Transcript_47359/g.115340 Transcript_47359/m.115340 type:complete len:1086 (-) Transcript_47359:181-3438(-)
MAGFVLEALGAGRRADKVPYNASTPCVANARIDDKYVCMGPGILCSGGQYVSGYGKYAQCKYPENWSPYILLLFLVFLISFFTKGRQLMDKYVPYEFLPVMHAFFAELTELGFVSLVAFLIERKWGGTPSLIDDIGERVGLGTTLHYTFEYLHWFLFGLAVCFVALGFFLLRVIIKQFVQYDSWSRQIEEANEVAHVVPFYGEEDIPTRWLRRRTLVQERELFLRLFERFIDPAELKPGDIPIDRSFNLGTYFILRCSAIMAEIVEVPVLDWFILAAFAVFPFIGFHETVAKGWTDVDAGYIVFWVYNVLVLLSALVVHWKLHSILVQIMPLEHNTARRPPSNDQTPVQAPLREFRPTISNSSMESLPTEERMQAKATQESAKRDFDVMQGSDAMLDQPDFGRTPVIPKGGTMDLNGEMFSHWNYSNVTNGGRGAQNGNTWAALAIAEWTVPPNASASFVQKAPSQPEPPVKGMALPSLQDTTASSFAATHGSALLADRQAAFAGTRQRAPPDAYQLFHHAPDAQTPAQLPQNGTDAGRILIQNASVAATHIPPMMRYSDDGSPPADYLMVSGGDFGSRLVLPKQDVLLHTDGGSRHGGDTSLSSARTKGPRRESSALSLVQQHTHDVSQHGLKASPGMSNDIGCAKPGELVLFHSFGAAPSHNGSLFVPSYVKKHHALAGRSAWAKKVQGRVINAHQSLFWFGAYGPHAMLRIIRLIALGAVVMVTSSLENYRNHMLCAGLSYKGECGTYTAGGVVLIIVACLIPIGAVLLLPVIIRNYVIINSVELMKSRQEILFVEQARRNQRTKTICATLVSLGLVIEQIEHLTIVAKNYGSDVEAGINQHLQSSLKNLRMTRSFERDRGTLASPISSVASGVNPKFESSKKTFPRGNSLELVRDKLFRRGSMSSEDSDAGPGLPMRKQMENLMRTFRGMDKVLVANLRELFDEVDDEHKGVLDKEGLERLLEATGTYTEPENVQVLFELMDFQNKGSVQFEEFCVVFFKQGKQSRVDPTELARKVWRLFDPRDSGRITPEHVHEVLATKRPRYDSSRIVNVVRHIDVDNRGWISKADFQSFVAATFRNTV